MSTKNDSETLDREKQVTIKEENKTEFNTKDTITEKMTDVFDITQPKDTETAKESKEKSEENEKSDKENECEKVGSCGSSKEQLLDSSDEENKENKSNNDQKSIRETKVKISPPQPEKPTEEEEHREEEETPLFEQLLEGKKTVKDIPESEYKTVISQLTYYEKDCKENYDVEGIAKCQQIEREINENYKKSQKKQAYQQYRGKMQQRLENAQENVDKVENKYKELMQRLQEKHQKELSQLHQKQEDELSQFETNWENSQKVRRFTKASTETMELRHIRRCIAKTGDVSRTKDIEMLERKAEARDIEEKSKQMYLQFEADRKVLLDKQKQNEEVLLITQEAEINNLNHAYRQDIEAAKLRLQNAENNIKSASNSDVVWNHHFRGERTSIPRPSTSMNRTRALSSSTKGSLYSLTLPPLSQTRPSSQHSMRPNSRRQSRPSTATTPPSYKREYNHFR